MFNNYTNRFKRMFESINSDTIKAYARLDKSNSFVRKRKMPLTDTILCTLSKKELTTAMELHQYFSQKGGNHISISKQGYLMYSIISFWTYK